MHVSTDDDGASPPWVICTLWIYEHRSQADVLFNPDHLPHGVLRDGGLARLAALPQNSKVRDFHDGPESHGVHSTAHMSEKSRDAGSVSDFGPSNSAQWPLKNGLSLKRYERRSCLFVAKEASTEVKTKMPALQIYMPATLAAHYGFKNRIQVVVWPVDRTFHAASHVELSFKSQQLSRADMWRLITSEMHEKPVHRGKTVIFMGTVKAAVKSVYLRGQSVKSAYFSSATKPIFRSEAARFTILIQMSKEMWEFDTDGSGEIIFNKVINGFLPDLFKRWVRLNVGHIVTIVMFTRVEYQNSSSSDKHAAKSDSLSVSESAWKTSYEDFYRVVVSEMASSEWIPMLDQLKQEFQVFLRDVLTLPCTGNTAVEKNHINAPPTTQGDPVRRGRPTTSTYSNIIQAISLAASQLAHHRLDRDMIRTGSSIVLISPGSGVYEVDFATLKATTDAISNSGIGVDLVCLSPLPLHSVPLFKYVVLSDYERSHQETRILQESHVSSSSVNQTQTEVSVTEPSKTLVLRSPKPDLNPSENTLMPFNKSAVTLEWIYAMPHWIEISFWTSSSFSLDTAMNRQNQKHNTYTSPILGSKSSFLPRCRMYEVFMTGLMEKDLNEIAIRYLDNVRFGDLGDYHLGDQQLKSARTTTKDSERLVMQTLKKSLKESDIVKREISKAMDQYDLKLFEKLLSSNIPKEVVANRRAANSNTLHIVKSRDRSASNIASIIVGDQRLSASKATGDFNFEEVVPLISVATAAQVQQSYRKPSGLKLPMTELSTPVNHLSRQISFGFHGFGAQKAIPSTGLSDAIRTRPSLSRNQSSGIQEDTDPRILSNQLRASLLRSKPPKTENISNVSISEKEQAGSPSQPIAIKMGKQNNGKNDKTDNESPHSFSPSYGKTREVGMEHLSRTGSFIRHSSVKFKISPDSRLDKISTAASPKSLAPPWLTVLNPCNPSHEHIEPRDHFRRWHHVYPKPPRARSVKWRSLCSPAIVPLTNDFFPSIQELAVEYNESPYKIVQNEDEESTDMSTVRENFIRELLGLRLCHGFQFISGRINSDGPTNRPDVFDQNSMSRQGAVLFMSSGSVVHQLQCVANGEVEVKRFTKIVSESKMAKPPEVLYRPYISSALERSYRKHPIKMSRAVEEVNWNYVDNVLAGYEDEFSENLRFSRARFVFIPVELTASTRQSIAPVTDDSEEEIRIDGIRQLTQLWQKQKWPPEEEQSPVALKTKYKDANPLAIEYQTRNPSDVIASIVLSGADTPTLADIEAGAFLCGDPDSACYRTTSYTLQQVGRDLQGGKGIRMLDRRWHLRLHSNCFLGTDLTTWILANFEDIETREDAVLVGNQLMEDGLFQHTTKQHKFRDGNYFYKIANEHQVESQDSKGGWFASKKPDRPTNPAANTDNTKTEKATTVTTASNATATGEINALLSDRAAKTSEASMANRTSGTRVHKPSIPLSRVMRIDVDQRKRSDRPEVVNLHYDRLHNPDNCFHICVDWLNATAKLIEDALETWTATAEKHGLRLVQVPVNEALSVGEDDPFQQPSLVPLAFAAIGKSGIDQSEPVPVPASIDKTKDARHVLQRAVLKRLDFVLDLEAASDFHPDSNVTYSWGRPSYRLTQFVHRTGLVLAQITDDGKLLLLANRLYTNSYGSTWKDASNAERSVTSLQLILDIKRFCATESLLKDIHDGLLEANTTASISSA